MYWDASFIGTCYREFENFTLALKWYEIALKLVKKLDPSIRSYKELVERKNCAEMRFYLYGSTIFKKEINQIISEAKLLPNPLRNSIEYNIAEVCRRTRHFDIEQEHLIESISLSDTDHPNMIEILARIAEFNNHIDDPSYQAFHKIELARQEKIYERRVKNAVFSFQYEDAGRWLEKWIKLDSRSEIVRERAAIFKHFGQIEDAIQFYRKAAESTNNEKSDVFDLILIALLKTFSDKKVNQTVTDIIQEALKKSNYIEKGYQNST